MGIKPVLQSIQKSLNKAIDTDRKAIAKIKTVSRESNKAVRHVKNVVRAIFGKEVINKARPMGKVTKALVVSIQTKKKCFESIRKNVSAAIKNMDKLEKTAAERKPSVLGTMEKYEKKIAQEKKEAPAQDKAKSTRSDKEDR